MSILYLKRRYLQTSFCQRLLSTMSTRALWHLESLWIHSFPGASSSWLCWQLPMVHVWMLQTWWIMPTHSAFEKYNKKIGAIKILMNDENTHKFLSANSLHTNSICSRFMNETHSVLTRNCSTVSAVLQHHQKWFTVSFSQLRRMDCPFTFAALKKEKTYINLSYRNSTISQGRLRVCSLSSNQRPHQMIIFRDEELISEIQFKKNL